MPDDMNTLLNSGVTQNLDAQPVADPAQSVVTNTPDQAPQTAPEAYEAFTLPEGVQSDDGVMKEAGVMFKQMNLTQAQVQQIIDFAAKKQIIGGMVDEQERLNQTYQKQIDKWADEVRANADFGGSRLSESLESIKSAINKLGGDPLYEAFKQTGAINHPEIFGAFVRLGRMFKEDSFVSGRTAAPASNGGLSPNEMARMVYPNMRHG